MFLVRKIQKPKWDKANYKSHGLSENEISANAVSHDLRTTGNQLSFWAWDGSDLDDVRAIALAIAATGNFIESLVVVWLPTGVLMEDGIEWSSSRGTTPLHSLAELHVDIRRLDYKRLGTLAKHVQQAVACKNCERLTKRELERMFTDAANAGRINLDELKESMKKYLP